MMDNLSESLRLAADRLPPSTIDIDALVRGERARRWQVRSRVAVAAAFLATAAVVAVPVLNPDTGSGGLAPGADCSPFLPSATWPELVPRADPPLGLYPGSQRSPLRPIVEAEDAAVYRLSGALRASLSTALQGFQVGDVIHPHCPEIRFEPDVPPAKYLACVWARDAAGSAAITVQLTPAMGAPPELYVSQYEHRETRPDGTMIGWTESARNIQVRVVRSDGTVLTLESQTVTGQDGSPDRPTLAATRDDLVAIGLNPDLTLYP